MRSGSLLILSFGLTSIAIGLLCLTSGCQLLGIGANAIGSDTAVKAKYVPAPKDSMLVIVESYGLAMDSGMETQRVAASLAKAIRDNKIAPVVDERRLEQLKDADPDAYRKMTIAQIGQTLGATQILYVNIWFSEIEKPTGGGQMLGNMRARVKIVDSQSANSRWPLDGSSEPVEIKTPWIMEDGSKTESDVRNQMADQMAQGISDLFRDTHTDQEPMEKASVQ
jgi:hypothetical protein